MREIEQIDEEKRKWNSYLKQKKEHKIGSNLGNAGWTKPVSLWHLGDFGSQAIHVAATITAVTQQQAVIVVSFPAHLAGLRRRRSHKRKRIVENGNQNFGLHQRSHKEIK